ncbi:MAG TPA: GPP34 family phosphoprotein [Candidatus Bathyarchaeia archaeon]|nr:GPP34 family phosphoprotein [Candidatus Bathyarchaeia archaeon]
MDTQQLSLAEELLLLALNDEKGTVVAAASIGLPYGLAGAALIELVDAGLLRLEEKEVVPAPSGSAGDDLLDGILAVVRSSKKTRAVGHWVGKLGRTGGRIKRQLLDRLVAKRILVKEERRLLWLIPTSRYPQTNPMPEYKVRERIRAALRGITPPDERTAALIGLVQACDLIGVLFERGERREAAKKAKEIVKSQPIGSAVVRAVQAVKTAVIAAAGS